MKNFTADNKIVNDVETKNSGNEISDSEKIHWQFLTKRKVHLQK